MIVGIYIMHVKKSLLKIKSLYVRQFNYTKKMETKNIVIDEKSLKDLVIYFTRYGSAKTVTMLNLYYHKLMGKIKEYERKKMMVDDYVWDKVLDRIRKIIDIEQFDNTKILIDGDDILPDDITLKNAIALMTSAINEDLKFHPQLFLEEAITCNGKIMLKKYSSLKKNSVIIILKNWKMHWCT